MIPKSSSYIIGREEKDFWLKGIVWVLAKDSSTNLFPPFLFVLNLGF